MGKLDTVGRSGEDSEVQGEGGWVSCVHKTNVIYVDNLRGVREHCFAIVHGAHWCNLEVGRQPRVVREPGGGEPAVGDRLGVGRVRGGGCVLLAELP